VDHHSESNIELLDELYHKRHLLVHGKVIPIIIENSVVSLPKLSTTTVDISGWYHKLNSWEDVRKFKSESVGKTIDVLYWEILVKLTQIFANFKNSIEKELGEGQFKLHFEHKIYTEQRIGSGSLKNYIYDVPPK
jgi:hypothetical protein